MDKCEAVGVLKTLIDSEDSSYIIEALELSIKSLQATESAQTGAQQLKPKMPTQEEMWDYLKSLPTPPVDVLLSGGMMMYYVNHCHDYMCRHFGH